MSKKEPVSAGDRIHTKESKNELRPSRLGLKTHQMAKVLIAAATLGNLVNSIVLD